MSTFGGGSVVDSKVVEFSLENGKFEENAAKSLSTIEKLKQALKFDNGAEGLSEINSELKNINFDTLNTGVETAKTSFSALEAVALGAFATIGSKIADVGLKIANFIPSNIISGGARRAHNIEQAKFQLEGLNVAWEDIYDDITYAVDGTRYGMDVAAKAAAQLVASQVQLGEDMQHALRGISGVGAMTNSEYEDIARIFTTIAGQGRVMGDQLNQLAGRGLNVASTLAEYMNKMEGVTTHTEAEIREMVSKGQIDFQLFADAMDDAFGKHATEANKTFTGVFANVKANLAKIGEIFALPTFEGFRRILVGILPLIKDVRNALTPFADSFGETFISMSDSIGGLLAGFHELVTGGSPTKVKNAIRQAFGLEAVEEASKDVDGAGKKVIGNLEKIRETALDVIRGNYDNGEARIKNLIEAGYDPETVQAYVNKVSELTNGTWEITDAILAEADAQVGLSDSSKGVHDRLLMMEEREFGVAKATDVARDRLLMMEERAFGASDGADEASKGFGNLELVIGGLMNIVSGFSRIFEEFGRAFDGAFGVDKAGIVKSLVLVFSYLSTVFYEFADRNAGNIADFFRGLFSLVQMLAGAIGILVRVAVGLFGIFMKFVGGPIINVFMDLLGLIGRTITFLQQWVFNADAMSVYLSIIAELVGGVASGFVGWVKSLPIVTKITGGFNKLKTALESIKKTKAFDKFKAAGTVLKNGFLPHLETTKAKWKEWLSGLKEKGGWTQAFSSFDNLKETFGSLKDKVLDYFIKFPGFTALIDSFKSLKAAAETQLTEAGVPVAEIKGAFEKLTAPVKDAGAKVKGFFTQIGQSEKLKKTSSAFKDAGKAIIDGFVPHLTEMGTRWNLFKSNLEENGGLKAAFSSFDSFGDMFKSLKTTVLDYLLKFPGFEKLQTAFKTLGESARQELIERGFPVEAVEGFFGTIWGQITGTGEKIKNFFKSFTENEKIQADLEKIKAAFGNLWTSLGPFWKNLQNAWGDFKTRIEELGGISFDNLGDIWTAFKETVGTEFANFHGFDAIKTAFGDIWTDIKAQLKESTGIDIDGIKQSFLNTIDSITEAINNFSLPDAFQSIIDFISGKLGLGGGGKEGTSVAKTITDTGEAIEEASGKIEKAGQPFLDFFSNLGEALSNFNLFESIKELFTGTTVYADELDGFDADLAEVGGVFSGIPTSIEEVKEDLEPVKTSLSDLITAVRDKIISILNFAVENKGKIVAAIIGFTLMRKVFQVFSTINSFAKGFKQQQGASKWKAIASTFKYIAIAIGTMVAAIAVLMYLSGQKGFGTAVAVLAAIVIGLGVLSNALSKMDSAGLTAGAKAMKSFALVIGVIAAALFVLTGLETPKLWSSVGAIAVILVVLAGVGAAIGHFEPPIKTIIAMAAMLALVAVVLWKLSELDNAEQLLPIAEGVALVLAALGVMGVLLSFAGKLGGVTLGFVIKTIAILAATAIVLGLLAEFGDVDSMIPIAEALGNLLLKLAFAMLLISVAGIATAIGGKGLKTLLTLAGVIGILAIVIGAIETAFPGTKGVITETLDNAIAIIDKFGELIGRFIGGIFAGFEATAFDNIGEVATHLVEFMEAIQPLNDIGGVDVGPLAEAILAVGAISFVGFIDSIGSLINEWTEGKTSAQVFSDDLIAISNAFSFWQTMLQSFDEYKELPKDALGDAMAAVGAISFQGLIDSLLSLVSEWQEGKTSAQVFSDDLIAISNAFSYWQTMLQSFDEFKEMPTDVLDSAIEAVGKASFEGLMSSVRDRLAEWIGGKSAMDSFGQNLTQLSDIFGHWQETMAKYGDKVPDISGLQSVITAVDSIEELGLKDAFRDAVKSLMGEEGDDPFTDFGDKVESLGRVLTIAKARLGKFSSFTFDATGIEEVVKAVEAVPDKGLISAIKNFFTGGADFDQFEKDVTALGTALSSFQTSLGDLDTGKLESAATMGTALADLLATLTVGTYGSMGYNLSTFSGEMVTFGENIELFTNSISDVEKTNMAATAAANLASSADTLSTISLKGNDLADDSQVEAYKKNVDKLVEMFTGLSTTDFGGADRFHDAVETLNNTKLNNESSENGPEISVKANTKDSAKAGQEAATAATDSFKKSASAMSDAAASATAAAANAIKAASSQFESAGFNLMSSVAAGIINNSSYVSTQARLAVGYAVTAASNAASGASEAGKDFATGFANGISNHEYFMTAAARIATRHAINASKDEEGAASPAKETYKLGKWFDEGYANAIGDYAYLAINASTGMVREAKEGLASASSIINSMLSDEMDTSPTITPVLDLSEIQNGVSGIGSMLNDGSVNLHGTLSSIGASAARRTTNSDLLAALTSLRGSLDERPSGDTYIVNGITYDDGTAISDAVGSLVRAVKVGRRV